LRGPASAQAFGAASSMTAGAEATSVPFRAQDNLPHPGLTVTVFRPSTGSQSVSCGNKFCVLRQNLTSISMRGTSISTPTTVASAAPEDSP